MIFYGILRKFYKFRGKQQNAMANLETGIIIIPSSPVGWGGGGTLIFSKIRRLWLFLGVQHFEFQYFGEFSEDFVDIFGGSSLYWTIFRGHFSILGSFLKIKVQNGGYFLGC